MTQFVKRHYSRGAGSPEVWDYLESTEGATPSHAEVTINARGEAQYSCKMYFETPEEMVEQVRERLISVHEQIVVALSQMGIPLAGQGSASKGK